MSTEYFLDIWTGVYYILVGLVGLGGLGFWLVWILASLGDMEGKRLAFWLLVLACCPGLFYLILNGVWNECFGRTGELDCRGEEQVESGLERAPSTNARKQSGGTRGEQTRRAQISLLC